MLSPDQRQRLLQLARASVAASCSGGDPPSAASPDPELREPRACFVTLSQADGSLRGCIGGLDARSPLSEAVVEMAAAAAARDPRFTPVTPEELSGLRLDISALTPPERVDPRTPGAIVVGRHGLVVSRGSRRGVLLPQVAAERAWSVETFLEQTCRKAGLAPDAHRDPQTCVERFEAEVFGEER
ncbi:MAG: AmmeMemoRadiSam system protein A [Deltaproteobacteria bacterium]|nr:AmmeMemoRadiSam system protein A [Deltaproteobacteria bacterium]